MSALPDYYAWNGYLSGRFDLTWEVLRNFRPTKEKKRVRIID
jgi:hypothetical protein